MPPQACRQLPKVPTYPPSTSLLTSRHLSSLAIFSQMGPPYMQIQIVRSSCSQDEAYNCFVWRKPKQPSLPSPLFSRLLILSTFLQRFFKLSTSQTRDDCKFGAAMLTALLSLNHD